MAKPNQVPELSMEEILASIRKIISEDEAKPAAPRPRIPPPPMTAAPANNVSRLFREEPIEPPAAPKPKADFSERDLSDQGQDRLTERAAIPSRLEDWDLRLDRDDTAAPPIIDHATSAPSRNAHASGLLSHRADAAVTSAFNHLASTVLTTNSRTIEQIAEEMMRPMLKAWLDDNLPPLVERLVREEIDRVSRRR